LMHEIDTIPEGIHIHMAPALCPLDVSPFDFTTSRQLMDRAMRSTQKWIDHGGLTRQAHSRELASHHH